MNRQRERVVPEVRTGRIDEAMARYCLGRDKMRKLAKEAGAVIKVGKVCLYDFQTMDAYMDTLRIETAREQ